MFNLFKKRKNNSTGIPNNSVFVMQPYRKHGCWVFDDPQRGLYEEAFVSGMSEILDRVLQDSGIDPHLVRNGFRLTFSTTEFPSHTHSLTWLEEEGGGNWYGCEQTHQTGWLCPALFLFFPEAPERLYARADKLD
tara:strand:+ start:552 stop:956 length:405 start_codon:yes stop_codon:yes gene_type:complete